MHWSDMAVSEVKLVLENVYKPEMYSLHLLEFCD